ncbi:MAG: hypothetical protein ACKVPX_10925 [Myxococcaceae bacterium]
MNEPNNDGWPDFPPEKSDPLAADPFADPFGPLSDPFARDPYSDPNGIPPDNEFGDGVRDPVDVKRVPGIRGFGGWTKSHEHRVYAELAGDVPELWPGASVVEKP